MILADWLSPSALMRWAFESSKVAGKEGFTNVLRAFSYLSDS